MNDSYPLFIIVFLFTLTTTVFCCKAILPFLKRYAEQPIYEDGPSWHTAKAGTPTMGGLSFLIAISIALLLFSLYSQVILNKALAASVIICFAYALMNAFIGITDDLTKLKHKQNAGLTPRAKLILQFLSAGIFLFLRYRILGEGTSIDFSFARIDLGLFYYPISAIILVGITNCANLTDGVDGLAASVAFGIGVSIFYISRGGLGSTGVISAAVAGGALGFLFLNVHPARIFMGDTGSLFLGSIIGALAFEIGNPFVAVISGGVYVIEGVSVILQVIVFKLTKKRLFKMAPLHHHFEKSGWDESKICLCALILTLLLGIPVFMICVS